MAMIVAGAIHGMSASATIQAVGAGCGRTPQARLAPMPSAACAHSTTRFPCGETRGKPPFADARDGERHRARPPRDASPRQCRAPFRPGVERRFGRAARGACRRRNACPVRRRAGARRSASAGRDRAPAVHRPGGHKCHGCHAHRCLIRQMEGTRARAEQPSRVTRSRPARRTPCVADSIIMPT